ncbi:MAG: glycoside hydrolase family 3 C-terminal domain-containing protein [Acidobacteria bacterium]|nr:glycoside hydrolase family 3 C-terminal domain-containing protein [Acidobacteriota bacterium]
MLTRYPAAILAVVVVCAVTLTGARQAGPARGMLPYQDSRRPVVERVDDLLALMTIDEKVGQMTQPDHTYLKSPDDVARYFVGSVLSGGNSEIPDVSPAGWAEFVTGLEKRALATRLGIPILYGIDAVHGHNNVRNAVIFPHNIGLGCTRNPRIVEDAARVTAQEVAATGMHWTFGPCLAVPQDERWGRTYEGFGETPELVAELGAAAIRGFQGEDLSRPGGVLASAKHYVGDGGTTNGIDQGDARVDEATLRRIHLPGYVAAVKAGVGSVMASFSSWNSQKIHGHKYLLTTVLKGELGFKGFVVSDWKALEQLPGDYAQQIEKSVDAGVDMVMVPDIYPQFFETLKTLVVSGRMPIARIDDAVRRILTVKFRMGLFERPFGDQSLLAQVGSAAHRSVARQAVRESLVLLANRNAVLPLAQTTPAIVVAGKAADDIGMQCGGWTITWQGAAGPITKGTTILQAIRNAAPRSTVSFSPTGEVAKEAKVAVVVIGEAPYAEMQGDRSDLSLDRADVALVRRVKAAGLPTVVVLLSGRPMIIEPILADADAIVAAWLPGTEGDGVADVLFGSYNPTGKLSHTWPRSMEQIPINVEPRDEKPRAVPLFEYGFGLRYR